MSDPHHRKTSIPPGTVDITGHEMRTREDVINTIRSVYERFGYNPQHTPILEHAIVFDGHHGAGEKLLFNLLDKHDEPLVLRYDLTVPLARVVSMYPELPRPYKRYQIAQVFRDDKEDKGHFREFTQCDGDQVGATSLMADAETIMMAYTGLKELGFAKFTIRVNHRAILIGIAEKMGLSRQEAITVLCRAIDSADKITKDGIEGIGRDLAENGIPREHVHYLAALISIAGDAKSALQELTEQVESKTAAEGIGELEEIFSYIPDEVLDRVKIDISLARGADYYTGFILEGVIEDAPIGAVLGGGRYDNLVSAFSGAQEPAVGMAFGLDRIMTAMKDLGFNPPRTVSHRRILAIAGDGADRKALMWYLHELRKSGVSCDLFATDPDEQKALEYARSMDIDEIIIMKGGTVTTRSLD